MNKIDLDRSKRKIFSDLSKAIADTPKNSSLSLSMRKNYLALYDWSIEDLTQSRICEAWIDDNATHEDVIEFCNAAEIMLSMIKSKMEVAA